MRVLILRGLPGSGKSWVASELAESLATVKGPAKVIVCSADDYFLVEGEYRFDPAKLAAAHAGCFRKFIAALSAGMADLVVVDNTNLSLVEVAPYLLAAQAFGAGVTVRTVRCSAEEAAARNTHGVPAHRYPAMVAAMADAEASWPAWWPPHG